jgi:hypothetical protein
MAGTGASLNPATAPISNMITGQIQSKNYANLLRQMLAGGGKLSMDAENVNIKAPVSALGQGGFGGLGIGNPGSYIPGGTKTNTTNISAPASAAGISQPVSQTGMQGQNLNINQLFQSLLGGTSATNPSSSPLDISSANLAGLTPENISSALELKTARDVLEQRNIANRLDMARTLQGLLPEPKEIFPIEVPGLGYVPLDVWKALPSDLQQYAAYRYQELAHGGTPDSYEKFITDFEPHERIQFLQQLSENPELMGIEKDLRASSAVNISLSPYEQSMQRTLGTAAGDILSPDYYSKIEKRLDDTGFRVDPDQAEAYAKEKGISYKQSKDRLKKIAVLDQYDKEIRSLFKDKLVERKKEGWYVDGELIVRSPYYAR